MIGRGPFWSKTVTHVGPIQAFRIYDDEEIKRLKLIKVRACLPGRCLQVYFHAWFFVASVLMISFFSVKPQEFEAKQLNGRWHQIAGQCGTANHIDCVPISQIFSQQSMLCFVNLEKFACFLSWAMCCLLRVSVGRFIIPPIWKYTTFRNIQLVVFPQCRIEFNKGDTFLRASIF